MNRGLRGENIFADDRKKNCFLEILNEESKKIRVELICYCIMNNHYNLILQNTSGKLSEFMRQVNGRYGTYYRKREGGKGYVFQNRYKSTLIQEDTYLKMAAVYVLLNPVRAGVVKDPYQYKWSSINDYFSEKQSTVTGTEFIREVFDSGNELSRLLKEWSNKPIEIRRTRFGPIVGNESFVEKVEKKFDRRKIKDETLRKRKMDYVFDSAEEIVKRFENERGVKINNIDINSHEGKKWRVELLVLLKDYAGLKYTEIIKYPIFIHTPLLNL